jgi:hypothetical protein
VVDSNVLIDVLRANPGAVATLDRAAEAGDQLWSPVTTRVEILGALLPGEEQVTRDLLGTITWQDVTIEIADRAAAHMERHRSAHSGIDLADYILAATADVVGGRPLTRNVHHFPMFQDLEPAY